MRSAMKRLLVAWVALGTLSMVHPALAGPGGMIARAAFETPIGRVALVGLTIFFLPLIIYITVKEKLAERRARRDLVFMARQSQVFEWLGIRERALDCFRQIHAAWAREEVGDLSDYITEWYRRNQQMVFLETWRRAGLVNRCEVKKLGTVKPLLFMHRNDDGEHQGSRLVLSITANMQDYLANRQTGKVVEGSKKFKDVETIWSFVLLQGRWLVSNIEEGGASLGYAKMSKDLPRIEETLVRRQPGGAG